MTFSRRDHARWRATLALLVGVLAGATTAAEPTGPRDRPPNIVVIMADDLGVGDLGCYGQTLIKTPRIDRLAAEGTRFTHAYAGAPVCAPSRCVLMTGLHTGHARVRDNSGLVGGVADEMSAAGEGHRIPLLDEDITVAEILKQAGYATAITGKWGLGEAGSTGEPNRQGFDESYGFLNQNHAVFHFPDYLWRDGRREVIEANRDGSRGRYASDLFTDAAADFIRRHRDRPFFLYVPFTLPHAEFEVPSQEDYAARQWPERARTFAAMVTHLDGNVGQILDAIHELGHTSDTLVLFTSDNGSPEGGGPLFQSNAPFRGKKGTLDEGGLRVPMIARWPGHVPAGRVCDQPWAFVDLVPTLADLAGARLDAATDGVSVAATLRGEPQDLSDRTLYWERPTPRFQQAVRRGRWKGVRPGVEMPLRLFDLVADPGESSDLAAAHPDVVQSLDAYLSTARTASPHWPDPPPATTDPPHGPSSTPRDGRPPALPSESSSGRWPRSNTRLPKA